MSYINERGLILEGLRSMRYYTCCRENETLHRAAMHGHVEIVQYLLMHGADGVIRDKHHWISINLIFSLLLAE